MKKTEITKSKKIFASEMTHKMLKDYCKAQRVPMNEAIEKITRWLIVNKVDLNQIDSLGNDMFRIHNYTVSYLKEFEKGQLMRLEKMIMAVMALVRSDKGEGIKSPKSILLDQVYFSELHQLLTVTLEKLVLGESSKLNKEDILDVIRLSNDEIIQAKKEVFK